MNAAAETLEFQSEAHQLFQLMIHSVYSDKDTFLRELVSNAADALDKLRLEALRDENLPADVSDLHIAVEIDPENRTLTVRDNGIGMSRADVIALIGTIAKSGTAELRKRLAEAADPAASQALIGRFGIGFYASFMVADQVTLLTRPAGSGEGTRWESAGDGTYTVETAENLPQGTSVVLQLKPEDADDGLFDYTSAPKIKQIVKKYSDFVAWPIRMAGGAEAETVNSMKALWARPAGDVTADEYNEFYQQTAHDWNTPLETIRLQAEGTFEYQALLFLPRQAPFDLFLRERKRGVQLYVQRVFIMDDCAALMPEYLRFVKGVVDAQDLPLNVSREILQQDRQVQLIRRRLVKKILSTVKTMMSADPDKYETFWNEFGRAVKEGLLDDVENRSAILGICSFASTNDPERPTSLSDYVARMKEGQEHIYYLTGESRRGVENSPHLEAFQAKGFEVLVLTDPIDEMWVDAVRVFDDKQFRSVARGEIAFDAGPGAEQEAEFSGLLTWLTTSLSEHVKEVRLSSRLTKSPACVVGDTGDITPTLEKMYRATGREMPQIKRILELNPGHPLVSGLRDAFAGKGDDQVLAETAELLYGLALLAEGGELGDPARFTELLAAHLQKNLPMAQ
ncbi:molecular chaperone HtpG [Kribbella yunnanensis]|uniref:Chaperone protein HtpG n=1 Tax=Kribbella yunnanensis TaxID=190194 RepID=A0ABP4TP67_9ACTN